ncbi:hypothetical protein D3C76_913590 [compost metagenome]
MEHKSRSASDKRTFAGLIFPGQIMDSVSAQSLHQQMPGWMESHIIKSLSSRIVTQQLRWIGVGETPQLQGFCRAKLLTNAGEKFAVPVGPFTRHCLVQGAIGQKQITVRQRYRLIKNRVCLPVHVCPSFNGNEGKYGQRTRALHGSRVTRWQTN